MSTNTSTLKYRYGWQWAVGWECSSLCSAPASLLLLVSSDIIRFWTTNNSGPIPRISHPPHLFYPQSLSHSHTLRLIYKSISWRLPKCSLHLLHCGSPLWHVFSCLSWFNLLMDLLSLCSMLASSHQAFRICLVQSEEKLMDYMTLNIAALPWRVKIISFQGYKYTGLNSSSHFKNLVLSLVLKVYASTKSVSEINNPTFTSTLCTDWPGVWKWGNR